MASFNSLYINETQYPVLVQNILLDAICVTPYRIELVGHTQSATQNEFQSHILPLHSSEQM